MSRLRVFAAGGRARRQRWVTARWLWERGKTHNPQPKIPLCPDPEPLINFYPVQGTEPPPGSEAPDTTSAQRIASPFARVTTGPLATPAQRKVPLMWLVVAAAILLVGGGTVLLFGRLAADPYRTLEPFPLETYLSNYHVLEGSRFRANLRVENDLGYRAGAGRLMVFSVEGDGRTLAALVPARLPDNFFSRGQRYTAELQVGDGGLIQINRYAKN